MTMRRRDALKTIGGLAGAATLGKFLSACGDDADGGPVGITTYVFLMLENRTYDHVLGARSWKEGKAGDGLRDGITQLDANDQPVGLYEPGMTAAEMCVGHDPPHGWTSSRNQWKHPSLPASETNNGFLKVHQASAGAMNEPMQYLTRTQQPITWALADAYTSCDRWFASILGPTLPNRAYFLAGSSAGFRSNDIIDALDSQGNPRPPLTLDTIFHRLRDRGIEWTTYYGNLPVVSAANQRMAESHKFDNEYLQQRVKAFGDSAYSDGRFFADAKAGTLPPVVYIEPAFYVNDDHPPTHPILAQALIASIYTALATSPQWKNCLFVVTYDEHGGFYDHVSPPTLPVDHDDTRTKYPTDENGVSTDGATEFNQLGFRVPTLVMGPYAKQGHVSSVQYDHTSTLKHLCNAFEMEPMSARVAHANDLTDCIDMDRLERGEWAPPIELPAFQFEYDADGEISAVTVEGTKWPYSKPLCAPGFSLRPLDSINEAAEKYPWMFEGYDLRGSEDHYLRSIHEFIRSNQGKLRRRG